MNKTKCEYMKDSFAKEKSVIVQRFYYSAVGTVKKVWFASSTRFSNYDLNDQVPNEVSTTDKVEESLWENSFLQSRGAAPPPRLRSA